VCLVGRYPTKSGTEVGLGPGDIMLDGNPVPPSLKGQTGGWIKMALGMEMGLGPGHIVLDGDPVPPPKKGTQLPIPIRGPFLLWPNGRMDQDATW